MSDHRAPAPTVTVRAAGSTEMVVSRPVQIRIPPSIGAVAPCPVAWTCTVNP